MKKNIKSISIRGRLACSLINFEKLLDKFEIDHSNGNLKIFIEKLWEVCTNLYIEDIEGYVNEIAPYSILEISTYDDFNGYDFITYEETINLKEFYLKLPADIILSMDILPEIAFGNLYGSTGDYSEITYREMEELADIFKKYDIYFTGSEIKIESSFKELHGWGKTHPRDAW